MEFKSYAEFLEEKLITFGNKAYPKFGNVVIMAGGAGSGKGFILSNLVGMEGKKFDVDELKTLSLRTPGIIKKVKDELGFDLTDLSKKDALKNPENVGKLHDIIGNFLRIPDKTAQTFYTSVIASPPDRKPNIIFDVTLKDLQKLQNITRGVKALGYDNKNIHIVWVINDIEVAKKQNVERDRTVPVEIFVNTHRGASQTMADIINLGKDITKYLDGDIVFAFNKIGVDSNIVKSGRGGKYIEDSNYFYVKRAGKSVTTLSNLSKDIRAKISGYVPKNLDWN